MAASGAVSMYHVQDKTPEAHMYKIDGLEKISFGDGELKDSYAKLNTGKDPDIVIVGCPHASLLEISTIANLLNGKKVKKSLWVCTSRMTKDLARRVGYVDIIEKAGGNVVADTCMVVAPIEEMGYQTTGVNSGKAGTYLPGFCKQKVVFASTENLLKQIIE
jgi:predicted aconitase